MTLDIFISDDGKTLALPHVTILTSDWGDVRLPESASEAFRVVPKNRWGLPDQRTRLGKRLKAYERRQLALANAAMGDFTPEEFV